MRSRSHPGLHEESAFDRQGLDLAQAEPAWPGQSVTRSRLSSRGLVTLRWWFLAAQVLDLGLARGAPELSYRLCWAVISLSCFVNLGTWWLSPGSKTFGAWEGAAQLCFDISQLTGLIWLTGGITNPFSLLLIAPVALAAATLPLRALTVVGLLGLAASVGLAMFHFPIHQGAVWVLDPHVLSAASANVVGILLIAGTVRQAAEESARMSLALDVTRTVLAREQRLSALGGLAAAAAHELGTPLATITIVAKEMVRSATTRELVEDAALLVAQTDRCREILKRLTDSPAAASDQIHEQMGLRQLLQEVLDPQGNVKGLRIEAIVTGPPGVLAPAIWRRAEILHALTTFAENAVDFARSEVLVTARYDAATLTIEVRDDGPGFPPDILPRLGEPYLSTRSSVASERTGHIGMGLGYFIAKTLLERTGAQVRAGNAQPNGAVVSARWARAQIEVVDKAKLDLRRTAD